MTALVVVGAALSAGALFFFTRSASAAEPTPVIEPLALALFRPYGGGPTEVLRCDCDDGSYIVVSDAGGAMVPRTGSLVTVRKVDAKGQVTEEASVSPETSTLIRNAGR